MASVAEESGFSVSLAFARDLISRGWLVATVLDIVDLEFLTLQIWKFRSRGKGAWLGLALPPTAGSSTIEAVGL